MNETEFRMLRELSAEGNISQRDLSKRVGLSLGGVNYILKELVKKGYIKTQRFKNSNNKAAYVYAVTPKGISARIQQTQYFLRIKMEEYEQLQKEIEELKRESVGQMIFDEGHGRIEKRGSKTTHGKDGLVP